MIRLLLVAIQLTSAGSAYAQAPFGFGGVNTGVAPSPAAPPLSAAALNAAGATKQDVNGDASGQHVTAPGGAPVALSAAINGQCMQANLYGADPTGATYSDTAWTLMQAAIGTRSSCVQFGAGTYKFSTQLSQSLSSTTLNVAGVFGAGSGATILYWPLSSGGLQFNMASDRNSFHVRGLTLVTNAVGTANAIRATNTTCAGNFNQNTVDDVIIKGAGWQGLSPSFSSYWATGLYTSNVSGLAANDVTVFGSADQHGNGAQFEGTNPGSSFPSGCFAIVADYARFRMFGGATGIIYGTQAQGVTVSASQFTNAITGISAPTGSIAVDQLTVIGSQFDTLSDSISIQAQMIDATIQANLFFVYAGHAGVLIQAGSGYGIHGNVFKPHPGQGATNYGVNVTANDTGNKSIITGNRYVANTVGNGFSAGVGGFSVQANAYQGVTYNNIDNGTGNTIGGGTP